MFSMTQLSLIIRAYRMRKKNVKNVHFFIIDHFSVSRNNTFWHRKMQNEEEATLTPVQASARTPVLPLQRIVLVRRTVNVSAIRALHKFWIAIFYWFFHNLEKQTSSSLIPSFDTLNIFYTLWIAIFCTS